METSFYLTPDLRKRLVQLPYYNAASNALEPFVNQLEVMEQDPTKRKSLTPFLNPCAHISYVYFS